MKTLFLPHALTLPLAAETLLASNPGPAGLWPQVVRHGSLRVLAPAGGNLFQGEVSGPSPVLPASRFCRIKEIP